MANRRSFAFLSVLVAWLLPLGSAQEQGEAPGSIRGLVTDLDWGGTLPAVRVTLVETGQTAETTESGNYLFTSVQPGVYTLSFVKQGYIRDIVEVAISSGRQEEINVELEAEFAEMDEFIVEDILQLGGGAEAALLNLRFESPSLLDSVGSDLISKAGASDAAGALRLVAGATVQDGKFAVVRGLPDRYVVSQMNGVRLPTAVEDKRAVELDQFPASVIESIQVAKTFTPDQQGDASGGAVDVRLRSIPEEFVLQFSAQVGYNSNAGGRGDFLSYNGGGLSFWGKEDGQFDPQIEGENWDGAVGGQTTDSPVDSKWNFAIGGKRLLDSGWSVGAFGSFFYERDSSLYRNGINDSYWIDAPGEGLSPEYNQGSPGEGQFFTSLFDVAEASQSVQWGNLATFGIENDSNQLTATYLYTRTAQETITIAEDTRGKEFYFPGYDPYDLSDPGNSPANFEAAPYLRTQTLEYAERTTDTLQLTGRHTLPLGEIGIADGLTLLEPEIDWTASKSGARSFRPDRRLLGAAWFPPVFDGDLTLPAYTDFKPAATFALGNLQRIFENIEEDSQQFALNFKVPFDQWTGDEGFFKVGFFDDSVERTFDQDTFSNGGQAPTFYEADYFTESWADNWLNEDHPITGSVADVDYEGRTDIRAFYGMVDLPLSSRLKLTTGARVESTDISVVVFPEEDSFFFDLNQFGIIDLEPGAADVDISQSNFLPALGVSYDLTDKLVLRGAFSKTIARQTFKELTPILQQEFLGGPIFIGNPGLGLSSLDNFDLRLDYTPSAGSFFSFSLFHKDITNPIEYIQVVQNFNFTSAVNYPEGQLTGVEFEARQDLGELWRTVEGLSGGVNATFLDASVTLPQLEIDNLAGSTLGQVFTERDMTNAPEYLYNLYLNYDLGQGTELSLFYTVKGDTLVSGATTSEAKFVPSIYERELGDLNFSVSHQLNDHTRLRFRAKNLLDTDRVFLYRAPGLDDVTRVSEPRGVDLSLSLSLFL